MNTDAKKQEGEMSTESIGVTVKSGGFGLGTLIILGGIVLALLICLIVWISVKRRKKTAGRRCSKCGFLSSDEAKFCRRCGNPLNYENIMYGKEGGRNRPDSGMARSAARKWIPVWILLAAALFLSVLAVTFWVLNSGRGSASSLGTGEFTAYYQPISAADVVYEDEVSYVDSQILLTAETDTSQEEIAALVGEYGGEIVGYISSTNDYQIQLGRGQSFQELMSTVDSLNSRSGVAEASLSYAYPLDFSYADLTQDPWTDTDNPDDSSGRVWDEQNPEGKNWWPEGIRLLSAWELVPETTETVKIGIIDSMFDTSHQDLDGSLFAKTWNNPENEDGSCKVADLYREKMDEYQSKAGSSQQEVQEEAAEAISMAWSIGHGTHVSGLIAAEAENGIGIAGVNQNVELYGYAVLSEEAAESDEQVWGNVFTFKYALALLFNEGVSVVNISMSWDTMLVNAQNDVSFWREVLATDSAAMSRFLRKYIDAGKEFLIFKCAGNNSENVLYDASYDLFGAIEDPLTAERIIIVGAAEREFNQYYRADFSNGGDRVDVYAPGVNILSDYPAGEVKVKEGTSQATPIAAGVASLVWGINPELSSAQVRNILEASCEAGNLKLDDRTNTIKEWFTDTEIVSILNAEICVQLALETEGKADGNEQIPSGTLTGVIYAMEKGGWIAQDVNISGITIYDSNQTAVMMLEPETIAEVIDYIPSSPMLEEMLGLDNPIVFKSYTALLEPGNYTVEVRTEEYGTKSQQAEIVEGEVTVLDFEFTEEDMTGETEVPDEGNESWEITVPDEPSVSEGSLFEEMPEEFVYASGAGGWATNLYLEDDGSFTGAYHDSDMGDVGADYPNGTIYVSEFYGTFTEPVQLDDYTWEVQIGSLFWDGKPGDSYIEDGIRYVYTEPFGMEPAGTFYIYLPGSDLEILPDEFVSCMMAFMNTQEEETLPFYGIYNEEATAGFAAYS